MENSNQSFIALSNSETLLSPFSGFIQVEGDICVFAIVNGIKTGINHLHLTKSDTISFGSDKFIAGHINASDGKHQYTFTVLPTTIIKTPGNIMDGTNPTPPVASVVPSATVAATPVAPEATTTAPTTSSTQGTNQMADKNYFTNPNTATQPASGTSAAGSAGLGGLAGGTAGLLAGAFGGFVAGEVVNNRFADINRDNGDIKQAIAVGSGQTSLEVTKGTNEVMAQNANLAMQNIMSQDLQTLNLTNTLNSQNSGLTATLNQQAGNLTGTLSTMAQNNLMLASGIKDTIVANATQINNQIEGVSSGIAATNYNISSQAANTNAQLAANSALINSNLAAQAAAINTNIAAEGAATRSLIEANRIQDLQTQIAGLQADARGRRTVEAITISNTNNNNMLQQQSQQQQQQQQIAVLTAGVQALINQNQNIHQGIVNLGTMSGAAGQQTAANTRVN